MTNLERLPLLLPPGSTASAGAGGASGGSADNGAAAPATVPLGQVASIERNAGPAQVDRLDRARIVTVEANIEGRPLSEVTAAIDSRLEQFPLPTGYTVSYGGDAERSVEVAGEIISALALAILLMYFVLVLQFGSSWTHSRSCSHCRCR